MDAIGAFWLIRIKIARLVEDAQETDSRCVAGAWLSSQGSRWPDLTNDDFHMEPRRSGDKAQRVGLKGPFPSANTFSYLVLGRF
jgi:hypothetical protein